MSHQCPACQRAFAEPGFCPFDGTKLVEAGPQTVVSSVVRAQSEADAETQTPDPAPAAKLRAISAHEGHAEAIAKIRDRSGEFDRLLGQRLDGRYEVLHKLGEGGMGVVFAARHLVIERPLAIKVLKRRVMRDAATIQRFVQEAKAASRIGHPNIVDVTDFGQTPDGMTYSVMEFVDGTTLSKTIKNAAPLAPARALRIAVQIGRALAAAHGKGIVHRDLKPENVFLVDRDGRPDFVKIVDFGIAKVQPLEGEREGPRLTQAGSVFGTPEYMAPEQAQGRGDTDHRVDIYALGTILYEMLVAKVPHKGANAMQTLAMQMLDPVVPPSQLDGAPQLPDGLEAIVMKALAKQREQRYGSMAELVAAIEQLTVATPPVGLPAVPPGAEPPAQPPRRAKPTTRPLHEPEFVAPGAPLSFDHVYEQPEPPPPARRWPVIVAGLIMLVLGAGGTILLLGRMRDGDTSPPRREQGSGGSGSAIAELPRDAEVSIDAAAVIVEVPHADAGTSAIVAPRDGGTLRPPLVLQRPDPKRTVTIEVMTRPGEADVWIGPNYRGPSGTRIAEPYGTRRKIECKTERMKGSVDVVFDGKVSAVMCTATRDRFCVAGLKNPWDDCETDPNAPAP